jgi:hypothetical protein
MMHSICAWQAWQEDLGWTMDMVRDAQGLGKAKGRRRPRSSVAINRFVRADGGIPLDVNGSSVQNNNHKMFVQEIARGSVGFGTSRAKRLQLLGEQRAAEARSAANASA